VINCDSCHEVMDVIMEEAFGIVVRCPKCGREEVFDYCHKIDPGNGIQDEIDEANKKDLHE